jgi:N-acetylneuraminate synthase
VVAELSANHAQNLDVALRTIEAVAAAGADAIKAQAYTPDTLTIDSDGDDFRIHGTLWDGRTLYELYREAHTPWEWLPRLQREAHDQGIEFFATSFDVTAVSFLESLDVPLHKAASFELVDVGLIEEMARAGKPLILSTGMGSLDEISTAVEAARAAGGADLMLLKCTSAYPAPPAEMNLQAIPHLAERFGTPVGLSDHTLGTTVTTTAVALGACLVEKHVALSRTLPSADSAFSLEPHELAALVEAVREAHEALGTASFGPTPSEEASLALRRSLFTVADVRHGEVFTAENIRSIRPAHGLPPKHLPEVLGRRAARGIKRGTPLDWSLIA